MAQRRLGGYRLPAGKQKGGSGAAASKKRGAAGETEAAAGGVSMAAIGEKQVAVVGWAGDSEGDEPAGTWLHTAIASCCIACMHACHTRKRGAVMNSFNKCR